ncbi:MAG: nuclear transport factor 2 family protein [Desulfobacteraceae bacterium]|jgi:hypothetical protein
MDNKTLEKTIMQLDAKSKIENIMGRYAFYLTAAKYHDISNLFTKRDDSRVEMNWGVYDGPEGIKRCYDNYHTDCISGPGLMAVHALTTPVIEVAGDLKTAKAVFVSPGHITGDMFSAKKEFKAHWAWMRYGLDFINEDGEWKIWHLHVYGQFMVPVGQSWVDLGDAHDMPPFPPEYAPDRPPTYSWAYSTKVKTELVPKPPLPYETFDEAKAY